jgi:peptide/nickel transport system substrate-binding protein
MNKRRIVPLFLLIALLAACAPAPAQMPTSTPVAATVSPTLPPPTATPVPRVLNVCLGQEPSSLYIYAGSRSQAMWSVLEAIYDGPIDYVNYAYKPVIVEKVPSMADGDAKLEAVTVKPGMEMVDTDGNYQTLQKDVSYFPSGCTSADCAKKHDGKSDVQMDQLSVTFKVKSGITWSDGTPLSVKDSVFSYSLAANAATPGNKDLIKKTASYTAADDQTVIWKGIPGFYDSQYLARFWIPLPEHILSGKDPAALGDDPLARTSPVGWGPYVLSEWKAGDHIQLVKNSRYFRASEGLPKVDVINFRFITGNSQQSVEALLSGECDLVDESTLLDDQLASIKDLQAAGKIQVAMSGSQVWEGLDFGIKPALYDSVPSLNNKARPDYFSDVRTRQAVAMCIDRKKIVDEVWSGFSTVPPSYFGADNPLVLQNPPDYSYNVDQANALLDQAGWKDFDNNLATPRVATTAANVYYGAPLMLKYYTTNADARKKVGSMIASDLAKCGIQVDVTNDTPENLFANGPDGVLFGRKFDLAEFSWSPSTMQPCKFYTTKQINSAANGWVGVNVTGYSSEAFDTACVNAGAVLPGQTDYAQKQQDAQTIFSTDLPVLPLYQMMRIGLGRKDLCGYQMDTTSRSALWNIEGLDYGTSCN